MEQAAGPDDLRQQVDQVATRISGYVVELEQVGVTIKDYETGLVAVPLPWPVVVVSEYTKPGWRVSV